MVFLSAEPVIFLYMYSYTSMLLLGQNFILDHLCLQRTGNIDCTTAPHIHNTNITLAHETFPLTHSHYEHGHWNTLGHNPWARTTNYHGTEGTAKYDLGTQAAEGTSKYDLGTQAAEGTAKYDLGTQAAEGTAKYDLGTQAAEGTDKYDLGTQPAANDDVRSEAVRLYMVVTVVNAVTSVVSSQVLGYWMDRTSRRILMASPVVGGILWAMAYVLVAYFETLPIYLIFVGVGLGGITGGYVTLKTAVTSYIVQETPPEKRTVRLSIIEAFIFLSAAASLFSMNLTTTYITKNYTYLFLGVEMTFILCSVYIFCILRDDMYIEHPHLHYSYDAPDSSSLSGKSNTRYGSMGTTVSCHQHHHHLVNDIVGLAVGDNEDYNDGEDEVDGSEVCRSNPILKVDDCSTQGAIDSEENSVHSLSYSKQGMIEASIVNKENITFTSNAISLAGASLAVPINASKAVSINSIYGTPPEILMSEERHDHETGNMLDHMQKTPSFGDPISKSLTRAGSVNTITPYGTPPQMLSTNENLQDLYEHALTDTNRQFDEDITVDKIPSNYSSLLSTKLDNGILENSTTLSSSHIVVAASVDESGFISHLAQLDKRTPTPSASIMTIQSQVGIGKHPLPHTSSLRKQKRERCISACVSDSALDIVDNWRNPLSTSERRKIRSNCNQWGASISTPESLNYLAFQDCGYTQCASSRASFDYRYGLLGHPPNPKKRSSIDVVDGKTRDSCCGAIFKSITDAIVTTFRHREAGLRAMIIADVIANFFVAYIVVAEVDNTFLYLNYKLKWSFSDYTIYFGIKCASDGAALLVILPLLRRYLGLQDAALGVLGGVSRCAFFITLALVQNSSQVYSVPFIGLFAQYLFVVERAIVISLVEEEEQGRVFTVLSSVDQLATLFGALTFDNLFSVFVSRGMPGVTLLIAGFLALVPTVIFGALYFSIKSRQRTAEAEEDDEEDALTQYSNCSSDQSGATLFV